jgi:DNA repair exonuclease SbcCD ATPase subunit
MNKIVKVVHLADIHIRKSPSRHDEYRNVFKKLYASIKKQKPDVIVIVGDLFHDYIDLQPEASILGAEFLNKLAEIAPLRITRGNHDIRKKSLKRIDSIEAVVRQINNPNIEYFNETGFYDEKNISWAVWKHGIKNNSPWNKRSKKPKEGNITIDLFHDPINGSISPQGYEFNSKVYHDEEHFKGDFLLAGDIHKQQDLGECKAYCGSLVEQDFGEGDGDFHGYLLWDLDKKTYKKISVKNDYSFNTVYINTFTDLDDLELELENPTKFNHIRVIWRVLPEIRNNENERKVNTYLKNKYDYSSIKHKNEFIEDDIIDVEDDILIDKIGDQTTQHEIFQNYLEKIGVDKEDITKIISLDDEITSRIEIEEITNIQWDILRLKSTNFMSYESIDIDFENNDGLYQIVGINTAGKTTINKLITYILYNKTIETESQQEFGDSRYVNNKNGADFCEGSIVIEANGEYYGIHRKTTLEYKKDGELKGAPTKLNYYKLSNPNEEFTDTNNLDILIEDDRIKTQKTIDKIIGTYKNFKRVAMTTSDTLNAILSNDRAPFLDSLLFDSGLDIFDIKLKEFKEYQKEYMAKPRVTCNVELALENISKYETSAEEEGLKINNIENVSLPELRERILKGRDYVESLTKKLYVISDELYNFDITRTNEEIINNNIIIEDLLKEEKRHGTSLLELAESYDEVEYNSLIQIRDQHKIEENDNKSKLRELKVKIDTHERLIEQHNGKIFMYKKEGKKYKDEIADLKNAKTCPTCGQLVDDKHRTHIDDNIKAIEVTMYAVADKIRDEESKISSINFEIGEYNTTIDLTEKVIIYNSITMEKSLSKIGEYNNLINDIEKRKEIIIKRDKIPPQIQILKLKNDGLQKNIDLYNQSLNQITENKKIESGITKSKAKLDSLGHEENDLNDMLYNHKTTYGDNIVKIRDLNDLIIKFEDQERADNILNVYKKCLNRDGIPTQLLINYAIPKINRELTTLLINVPFNIWLDSNDLKLKLATNNVNSTINVISGSGKERTFASICLKFSLNQINAKSKPTILLLDEIMGKLTEESIDEFVEILEVIKDKMKIVLVIEHNHPINPDYIIEVEKDENEVSSLMIRT